MLAGDDAIHVKCLKPLPRHSRVIVSNIMFQLHDDAHDISRISIELGAVTCEVHPQHRTLDVVLNAVAGGGSFCSS